MIYSKIITFADANPVCISTTSHYCSTLIIQPTLANSEDIYIGDNGCQCTIMANDADAMTLYNVVDTDIYIKGTAADSVNILAIG